MYNVFQKFFGHIDLYTTSTGIGLVMATIYHLLYELTEKNLFGLSLGMWLFLFIINVIDIYTGIKADTKRKKDLGANFKFESAKGWRVIEKIFIFTVVIGALFTFEKEAIKIDLPEIASGFIVYIKVILFFYAFLIELQSIGENEEARFGKKGKMFVMLDSIIHVVNEGILKKLKNMFNSKDNDEEPPIENIEQ